MAVLMVHPALDLEGGISHYVVKVKPHFAGHVVSLEAGRRAGEARGPANLARLRADYRMFRRELDAGSFDVVHLNPSMEPKMVLREAVYARMAGRAGAKVVVFWRGWSKSFERCIDRFGLPMLRRAYGTVDRFVVLSREFEETLRRWGFRQPVHREVAVVEDEQLDAFDAPRELARRGSEPRWRVLFLSRVVRDKGVFETIEAFDRIRGRLPRIDLVIAGDGADRPAAERLVQTRGISGVRFVGWVSGAEKYALMRACHVLCLPTRFMEGFPNVIAEAMAMGLPLVTCPVAGIADLFERTTPGFLLPEIRPAAIAEAVERLFLDIARYERTSLANAAYARSCFRASDAAHRLEAIYSELSRD